ncbi:phage tail tape measure protein [Bengtsoniella intestinalis]|uniref:phage tail tape measure protein n=1 Tax=Bengtsoniella intestinalis TaxID=3073143 RepID=UPI00391EF81D
MASRKEYEMLFKLNAELGSTYKSTYSEAQSAITSMQNEISELGKVQSDISSYQKQQASIEATRKKMEVLQQQYDNIQKEIQETEGYSSSLENKLLSKQQQIDKTSASLETQTSKLNQMGTALNQAGVDTSDLTTETDRLQTEINELKTAQEEAADAAEDFGDSGADAIGAVADILATAGIAAMLNEIKEAFMDCVEVAGEFEASMSNVEALSGATSIELAALTEEAKDLGATTKYTATQVGDAMGYMGMAGWDATEMLEGMNSVLVLATAAGEDLANVSDIVTDNLTAFGLTAADTAMFSDVLATAATNSNTSVSIMGETFKTSASVAGALGYSVQDVAVAVGLMANSGVKGSIAGTALKNTFTGLLSGATLTSEAFGDVEYTTANADGTMKDFSDTIDDLRAYFDQMTEAEQVNNAVTIAGTRGYNGLLAILNATDEEYASLTASINDSTGAAEAMAEIKLDNMVGDLTIMQSAWDGLSTTVGELFIPEMRSLYEIGTDVLNLGDEFVQDYPYVVKGATAFVAVVGVGTTAMTGYAAATKLAAMASVSLTAALPALGVITGVAVAAGTVYAALSSIADEIDYETIPSVKDLTSATENLNDVMKSSDDSCESTIETTVAAANVAEKYIAKLEALGDYTSLNAEEQAEYNNILAVLCQVVPELSDYIDLETGAIEGGTAALYANTEAWKQNAIQQAYVEQLSVLHSAYADVLVEEEKNIIGLRDANAELTLAEDARAEAEARMAELALQAEEDMQAALEKSTLASADYTDYLTEEYRQLENSLEDLNTDILNAEDRVDAYSEALDENADAVDAAKEEIDLTTQAVENLTASMSDGADASDDLTRGQTELNDLLAEALLTIEGLAAAYDEAYDAAYDSITGQYSLWDAVSTPIATSVGTMNTAIESQIALWESYGDNLDALGERTQNIEGLSDLVASFADGSEESISAIAGMASASDSDLIAMVENWQALQEAQGSTAGSLADLETEFSLTKESLQGELADAITEMDLGSEAATSGENTIQGFIDGALALKPQVEAAYAEMAQAAMDAIDETLDIHSPSRVMEDKADMTWAGYINQTRAMSDQVKEAMADTALAGADAVTDATSDGAISASVPTSGGGTITIQISPTYHIQGSTSSGDITALLDAQNSSLKQLILDALEEAGIDKTRRAFA